MQAIEDEWVRQVVGEADRARCAARVLSVEKRDVVAKGDNYTSELSRLTLKLITHSGEVRERTLIYKCLPPTELRRKHIAESGLFVIEKRMYTEVLPLMEKIRRSKEVGEPLWGECYGARNYESLLLEDLAVHGYKMGERMKGLDFEHCKLVMRSLAKFHALGAVLKQNGDLILRDYEEHFVQKNVELMANFYKSSFQGLAEVAENEWKGEWVPYAEKLRKKSETVLQDMIEKFAFPKDRFATINHGDCWVNNMLFKYSYDGTPVALRFVDFQVCLHNIVGIDLEYFLSTSLSLEVTERRDELVAHYHERLVSCLGLYGYSGRVPSLQEVVADCEHAALFGLAMSVLVMPFMKMPSKDVPDIEALMKDYDQAQDIPPGAITNSSREYELAMKEVLRRAERRGVL